MDKITFEFATRDDCLDKMVPSDLRILVSERDAMQDRSVVLQDEIKRLWGLLDDISTAGDMYKPPHTPYFIYVNKKADERDGLPYSDGYDIFINESEKLPNSTS